MFLLQSVAQTIQLPQQLQTADLLGDCPHQSEKITDNFAKKFQQLPNTVPFFLEFLSQTKRSFVTSTVQPLPNLNRFLDISSRTSTKSRTPAWKKNVLESANATVNVATHRSPQLQCVQNQSQLPIFTWIWMIKLWRQQPMQGLPTYIWHIPINSRQSWTSRMVKAEVSTPQSGPIYFHPFRMHIPFLAIGVGRPSNSLVQNAQQP